MPKKNKTRKPVTAERLITLLSRKIQAKADFYRSSQSDPHNINTALYVAMLDCEAACIEALRQARAET